MLDNLQQQTILAALQNGLGLTHPCKGLNLDVKKVSEFINSDENFKRGCQERITSGYQMILTALNKATGDAAWEKRSKHKIAIDNFIVELVTWGCLKEKDEITFEEFTFAIRRFKTILEAGTALGMTETEIWRKIYSSSGHVMWLIQNGFQV